MRMPALSLQVLDLEHKVENTTYKWKAQNQPCIFIIKSMQLAECIKNKSLMAVEYLLFSMQI